MRKKIAAVGAALALGLTLTACSSTDAKKDDGKADGSKKIILVSKGFQHQFWQAVKQGAVEAGKEFGYEIEFNGPKDEQAIDEQLNQLEAALAAKPAAIGFAALDSGAAKATLEKIKDAKIPVIAFDSGVDSDIPLTTVQTDNKAAAGEAAKQMVKLVGDNATVGLICHDQTSQTGIQRCDGFQEYIKKNAPGIKLLPPVYAGDVAKAADAAKATIQANPDIKGLYGTNEAAANGVLQGVKEAGKGGAVTIVGFDSGKDQIEAVKDGTIAGAVTQSPVKIGYQTVKAAVAAIKGEKLEKIIDSGFAWYDKTNIDNKEIKDNLYE